MVHVIPHLTEQRGVVLLVGESHLGELLQQRVLLVQLPLCLLLLLAFSLCFLLAFSLLLLLAFSLVLLFAFSLCFLLALSLLLLLAFSLRWVLLPPGRRKGRMCALTPRFAVSTATL